MPQRFWKLVLEKDMSGGGKGVSTAAAIGIRIDFLSFHRLEHLPVEKVARAEMDSLLWVYDYIVEFFQYKDILHAQGLSTREVRNRNMSTMA
ncbi:rop guanine nucleotide exchange factor 12-like [Triticum aestivum]|uniref:rop guanine nucleotide exchange factor 12-like n=1 Tax=Triticum aestivum TaxID=4565 RepID=UPI001D01B272|nr:rop guanine nucleotide exchange factor 12-like [Triticum aestivum]